MTKAQLVEWLVKYREDARGSISPHNHRRLLLTRTKKELEQMKRRIEENWAIYHGDIDGDCALA